MSFNTYPMSKSQMPRHGSSRGYNTYKCRCDECKAWAAEAERARRERRSKAIPKNVHGTTNGYANYNCRCAECTAAQSAKSLELYHRNKQAARDLPGQAS